MAYEMAYEILYAKKDRISFQELLLSSPPFAHKDLHPHSPYSSLSCHIPKGMLLVKECPPVLDAAFA